VSISVPGARVLVATPDAPFDPAGIPVKVVSERLGRGNPAFTIDTYQHVLPGMQSEAARMFESLIVPEGSTG